MVLGTYRICLHFEYIQIYSWTSQIQTSIIQKLLYCTVFILYYQKTHESWEVCELQSPCIVQYLLLGGPISTEPLCSGSFLSINVRTTGWKNVFREGLSFIAVSYLHLQPFVICTENVYLKDSNLTNCCKTKKRIVRTVTYLFKRGNEKWKHLYKIKWGIW